MLAVSQLASSNVLLPTIAGANTMHRRPASKNAAGIHFRFAVIVQLETRPIMCWLSFGAIDLTRTVSAWIDRMMRQATWRARGRREGVVRLRGRMRLCGRPSLFADAVHETPDRPGLRRPRARSLTPAGMSWADI